MEIFVGSKTNNIGTIRVPLRRKLPSLPIPLRSEFVVVVNGTLVFLLMMQPEWLNESDLRKDWFIYLKTLPMEELKKIVHGFDRE